MRLIIQEELDLFEAKLMPVLERHNLAITQSIGALTDRVERIESFIASLGKDSSPSPAVVAPEVGLERQLRQFPVQTRPSIQRLLLLLIQCSLL